MEEIIKSFENEKETILRLIELDNKINHANIKYNDLLNILLSEDKLPFKIEKDTLFITEGEPKLTITILKSIFNSKNKCVLFVNQKYLGINKWLIARYNELVSFSQIYLDCNNNYNKYFKTELKVIPLGEKEFIDEIYNDFYKNNNS